MAANGNHRDRAWDARVSPVIRAVGCFFFFNEPVPAKSLAAVGVEGKGGETSLHLTLLPAVGRDLTPTRPARPPFPTTPGGKSREAMPHALQRGLSLLSLMSKSPQSIRHYHGGSKNNHRNALEVIRQGKA